MIIPREVLIEWMQKLNLSEKQMVSLMNAWFASASQWYNYLPTYQETCDMAKDILQKLLLSHYHSTHDMSWQLHGSDRLYICSNGCKS